MPRASASRSTTWPSRLAGYELRLAGSRRTRRDRPGRESRFVRLTVRHCGYGDLTYGTHGLYLKRRRTPSSRTPTSATCRRGQCVSPRAAALIRGNRLHHCTIGVGYFDYARGGGSASLRIIGNDLSATSSHRHLPGQRGHDTGHPPAAPAGRHPERQSHLGDRAERRTAARPGDLGPRTPSGTAPSPCSRPAT